MKLLIDIGNTFTKLATWEKGQIGQNIQFENAHPMELNPFKGIHFSNAILSSVKKDPPLPRGLLSDSLPLLIPGPQTPLPIRVMYSTPETLGIDRIAGAVGGHSLFPKKPVLVIDAGTCITYDFIDEKGQYWGGAISPGMQLRFKALHHFTDKLPQLSPSEFPGLIGNSTNSSILSGVQLGLVLEMEGMIGRYQKQFKGLVSVLTGGDAIFLSKQLKKEIFADSFLIFKGLGKILDFNNAL